MTETNGKSNQQSVFYSLREYQIIPKRTARTTAHTFNLEDDGQRVTHRIEFEKH